MERRAFLQHFIASTAMLCPVCSALAEPTGHAAASHAEEHGPPHWSYEGHGGPGEWSKLAPEYGACGIGREQSPINLDQPIASMLSQPTPNWQAMPLEVVNNGHTIQVNCAKGSTVVLDGVSYELLQYHFHHPSEHHIGGMVFDMEIHFVHRSADGGLAVLGVMLAKGAVNTTLETIWRHLPEKADEKIMSNQLLQPAALLPKDSTTYRYAGSLTTPPCSEVVSWVVYRQPVTASAEQIDRFAQLFPNNARPVQPLNRRKLLLDIL